LGVCYEDRAAAAKIIKLNGLCKGNFCQQSEK